MRSINRIWLHFVVLVVLLISASGVSVRTAYSQNAVELEVCNETIDDVFISVAGFDADSARSDFIEWRSEGWWKVEAFECEEYFFTSFLGRHLFIHGESSTGTWEGNFLFCVHENEAFELTGTGDCERHGNGYVERRFIHRTNPVGSYVLNFTE